MAEKVKKGGKQIVRERERESVAKRGSKENENTHFSFEILTF